MTKKKIRVRDPKADLQEALREMPSEVAQHVREAVKRHKPELLRGVGKHADADEAKGKEP